MAINPIKINNHNHLAFKNKQGRKPYLEAEGAVNTDNLVKPLPPKGHLIHDNLGNSIKYFFKDRAYELKAIRDGLRGTANDHQLGRLNDVGLVTAGLMIATFLASKTTNPKARIMEYVGLGAFLTAMSIYPKIAINGPAKLLHGYDIDKEYIDDQGRKKSVMQDSNYVPYDMYLGEIPEENLSIIGDKMGIPRDIKNRNDVIREQMRKIATQNNTLWMLTAGITPALTALMCCGLENYVVAPALEKTRNSSFNSKITKMLDKTINMTSEIKDIKANQLSKEVELILSKYKGQELPKQELNNLIELLTQNIDANASEGITADVTRLLKTSANKASESFIISNDMLDDLVNTAKTSVNGRNRKVIEKVLIPTREELEIIFKSIANGRNIETGVTISAEELNNLKTALKDLLNGKIKNSENIPKEFLNFERNNIVENIIKKIKVKESLFVSEESFSKLIDLSKILGEFKENQIILDKCKSFKFEQAPETVLARYYSKFEKTLLDSLGIRFKDLQKMRESEEFTKTLLDKKITELCKNETRYIKAMEKFAKIFSEMEVALNGDSEVKSFVTDLINAIENNYNNTAIRISKLDSFKETVSRLVKQDVKTLGNSIHTKQELFDLLDGLVENEFRNGVSEERFTEYLRKNAAGKGSSKNQKISRIIERYQGVKNAFNRVIHTLDVYKRSLTPEQFSSTLNGKNENYIKTVIEKAKEALLSATSSDHTLKLDTVNNPDLYKDIMNSAWAGESGEFWSTKQKGILTKQTKEAFGKNNSLAKGNILDRLQYYITRFRNLVGNSTIDFTKPEHKLNEYIAGHYTESAKTRVALFNLIGQNPVDMVRGAAARRYATQKWVRIISTVTASVFGIAFLAQLGFGKLNNPQNLQKQVENDSNK